MWSKLIVTDGTKTGTVDLLRILKEWLPTLAAAKESGYWSGSSFTQGRQLYDKQFENVIDTFMLDISTGEQSDTIALVNLLIELLDKAVSYWTTDEQTDPVWLEMRPECQDESQYAIIMEYSLPQIDEIFAPPFSGSGLLEGISLIIEHGLWSENEPTSATAIELSGGNSLISESTDRKSVWLSNYYDDSPLTHIFVYDASGGTYTNITGLSGVNLLPAVPAAGDFLYIGVQDDGTNSPFDNIVFNIGTAASGLTLTPEYSTAAGWAALPVAGYGFRDDTSLFTNTGRNIIVFDPVGGANPWSSRVVNGVTAWWIRFWVQIAVAPVCPTQQTDAIYTNQNSFFELASDQISGTYPAQAKIELWRRDNSNSFNAAFITQGTQVVAGLRSLDRGAGFQAFLNTYNNATPTGVSWTNGGASATVTNLYAPTYRFVRWSSGGVVARPGTAIGYWTISDPTSRAYTGKYRAFLRVTQQGTLGDMEVRLGIGAGGFGSTSYFTEWKRCSTTANVALFQTFDMGIVDIPAPNPAIANYAYDVFISVWGTDDGGVSNIQIYDLVLIPIDECPFDAQVVTATPLFDLFNINNLLVPDSITWPKMDIATPNLSELLDGTSKTYQANWQTRTPGEIFWQHGKDQRLWVLLLYNYNYLTGGEVEYSGIFHSAITVRAWRNQRYKMLRGEL